MSHPSPTPTTPTTPDYVRRDVRQAIFNAAKGTILATSQLHRALDLLQGVSAAQARPAKTSLWLYRESDWPPAEKEPMVAWLEAKRAEFSGARDALRQAQSCRARL